MPDGRTSGRKLCFAYVGRLVPEKGLTVLLESARILRLEGREFEVVLIGDGPQRSELEAIIQRTAIGDCVRIRGFLRGAALAEAVAKVDLVVMPSVWEETAGLSAIEQMKRGRPVIASKIGGLGEVVGEASFTCRPGDAEDLARCMREALDAPANLAAIVLAARQRACGVFHRPRMIMEHAELYTEIAQHPLK